MADKKKPTPPPKPKPSGDQRDQIARNKPHIKK